MAGLEWFNKWRESAVLSTGVRPFINRITHLHDEFYAIAGFRDYGDDIQIYKISKKEGTTDELNFLYVLEVAPLKEGHILSLSFLSESNTILATSELTKTRNYLDFYKLPPLGKDTSAKDTRAVISKKNITPGKVACKPVILATRIFYIAIQEGTKKLLLEEVDTTTQEKKGTSVTITPPPISPIYRVPSCFAFVDVNQETKLMVALGDGNLYYPQDMSNETQLNLNIQAFEKPFPEKAIITDMTLIEDGRLAIIYSTGDIYITTTASNTEFQLLERSMTDTNNGNNKLLSLPGNILAASFKRNNYPRQFPSSEEIARTRGLIKTVACGLYIKLAPGGPSIGERIWYGQTQEIMGLSMIPQGIISGDLSWMSIDDVGGYMLHTYTESAVAPPPPPASTRRSRPLLPPPALPAILPKPKPRGVNAEVQLEDNYNSPEDEFEEPPVNTAEFGTETEPPLEEVPENIDVNAAVGNNRNMRLRSSNAATNALPINVSFKSIKILHGDKSTPYSLQRAERENTSIIRAKAGKDDTVAYVIPTIEERPGMKIQYRVHESNEGWIDTDSGASIPLTLVEGVNELDIQVVLIKRNRLDAGNDPTNKNMQPVVKEYTVLILKPEEVYLENLRLFAKDRQIIPIRFNRNTLEYSVKVPQTTENLLIRPTAPMGKNLVLSYLIGEEWKPAQSDAGFRIPLAGGENKLTIKVKGQLGIEVEYIVHIHREETGWWVPADMGLPTYQKTQKNKNRAKNIMREMRLANQTRRRINADKATAEAAKAKAVEEARIQRLKNARSGKLVSAASTRPVTPRPATPVARPPTAPVNEERLAALRAAQEERSRAALQSAKSQRRASIPSSAPSRPASSIWSYFSGQPRARRPVTAWHGGRSRKANRRTRRRKSRRVRR